MLRYNYYGSPTPIITPIAIMQRIKPVYNEIYHIYNRGVEKRKIFLEDRDYLRFVQDLFEFNDDKPVSNVDYYFEKTNMEVGLPYNREQRAKKSIVEILAFCLMPNHFHLMARQNNEDGITEFMRKIGTGYTNYFNLKYERVGPLFQGKYKFAHIKKETHFIHLPNYIHANPLELLIPKWREGKLKNLSMAMSFLEKYRWSSFSDYIGKQNFPLITSRDFLADIFGSPRRYFSDFKDWLEDWSPEIMEGSILE